MKKRLCKSATDKQLCGVCGGIARYFDIDATIVRVIYVILSVMGWWVFASPIILYIALALIMPKEEAVYGDQQYAQPQCQQPPYQPPYQQPPYQQAQYRPAQPEDNHDDANENK